MTRLHQIKSQNRFLTAVFVQANKETIEECVTIFQDGIDRFQVGGIVSRPKQLLTIFLTVA
jgi:hypothetical protein